MPPFPNARSTKRPADPRSNARRPDGDAITDQRLHALDVWRGGFLLLGVLLHTAYVFNLERTYWVLRLVPFLSSTFRMEGFFGIAGFLAAKSLRKHQAGYAARRTRQLAIPFITGTMLCVPLAHIFMKMIHIRPSSGVDHLWFLVTLMFITCVAYYIYISGTIHKISDFTADFRISTLAFAFIVVAGSANILTLKLIDILIGAEITGDYFTIIPTIIRATYFLLYYIATFVIAYRITRPIAVPKGFILAGPLLLLTISLLYFYFEFIFSGSSRSIFEKSLSGFITPVVATAVLLSVFASAPLISSLPEFLNDLSSASYTIYIVHYPVVFAAYFVIVDSGLSFSLRFCIVLLLSLSIPYFLHNHVVRKLRWAAFLFNGKDIFSSDLPLPASR